MSNLHLQQLWCIRFLEDVQSLFPRAAAFVARSLKIFAAKGPDYAPEAIALMDVHYIAWATHTTPERVLYILATKQWTAVRRFVTQGHVESESIHARLNDMANYAALLDFQITHRHELIEAILDPNKNLLPCLQDPVCFIDKKVATVSNACENCQFMDWLVRRTRSALNDVGNTSGL